MWKYTLAVMFAAALVAAVHALPAAAGDPIARIDIGIEQIPGGIAPDLERPLMQAIKETITEFQRTSDLRGEKIKVDVDVRIIWGGLIGDSPPELPPTPARRE